MATEITSRDDLSFTLREKSGMRHDWHLGKRRRGGSPSESMQRGRMLFEEIAKLAQVDEFEAYSALLAVLLSEKWDSSFGEENGLADAVVRLVMVGLRARMARAALPFEPSFNPTHAEWVSVHARLDSAEAQLASMNLKPWRKPA